MKKFKKLRSFLFPKNFADKMQKAVDPNVIIKVGSKCRILLMYNFIIRTYKISLISKFQINGNIIDLT